ncbi:MAG: NADH-quinone oxidoreductase subunit L [Bacteroidetes bacterium]|nr:NADH-quinone oxidoreductase subunit L [Bacteroidota bacterium]
MSTKLAVQLIILLPLIGATVLGLFPLFARGLRQHKTLLGTVGTLIVAVPFGLTFSLFAQGVDTPVVTSMYTWMGVGDFSVNIAYRIDQLSLIMTLVVTGVGALIHLYAIGYMAEDRSFWKFFSYLNLFIFMMLNLVLADNLLVMFLGWEGVGLCSYLLIGFWYEQKKNSAAASKAFIVNRVGDFAFLIAMFILVKELGSLDFATVLSGAEMMSDVTIAWVVLLLFLGATGKSAQIPLFVWLPDAMAGPTPVSALIHAATMVTSGLYLLARLSPLVLMAPEVMVVIAIVGATTAIVAATVALTQTDIKRVLAYSTVSQLGYMFMAAGVGAFFVAIFHVVTHAFFKACLFLGSGSVIHGMHHVEHEIKEKGYEGSFDAQDMSFMGGLKNYMPITRWTYLLSTLAIAGIPLTAGFFSKDEILFKAFEYGADGNLYAWFVWGIGILTALLTAFYMMRSYMLTFEGSSRWPMNDQFHPHESPGTMTMPLVILAGLSMIGGAIGFPKVAEKIGLSNWIHDYLVGHGDHLGPVAEPDIHSHVSVAAEIGLILLGAAIAVIGVLWAWRFFAKYELGGDELIRSRFGALYRWWNTSYYWDMFYDRTIVRPIIGGAQKALAPFDKYIVDGIVNTLGRISMALSWLFGRFQTGVVQNYALAIVLGTVILIALFLF